MNGAQTGAQSIKSRTFLFHVDFNRLQITYVKVFNYCFIIAIQPYDSAISSFACDLEHNVFCYIVLESLLVLSTIWIFLSMPAYYSPVKIF